MKLFYELSFRLYFWCYVGYVFNINIEARLVHFFPAHLLYGGSEEEEFEFVHHHDFGDLDHDLVEGHVVETGLFLCVLG